MMAHKQRPFTRRQRAVALKQKKRQEREDRLTAKLERREFFKSLAAFKGCDPTRTEELADDYRT